MKKTVAILGAGPSGLVTAKYALENGLIPFVIEKNSQIGGIWNPNTGYVWPSMRTNLSKYTCSFEGMPWDDSVPTFPTAKQMFSYLTKYADNFDLLQYIKFNSKVTGVTPNNDGYQISWEHRGNTTVWFADYVVIATGIFVEPYIPNIEGLDNFTENIIHTKDYKGADSFKKGDNILVIGGSFSGAEVSADIATKTHVTHSFKESFWIQPRYIPKPPMHGKFPLDLVLYNRKFYEEQPSSLEESYIKKNSYMDSLCSEQRKYSDLEVREDKFKLPIKVATSDVYLKQVATGMLQPLNAVVTKFDGKKVLFSGQKERIFDTVIMATGFKTNLEYLGRNILKKLKYNPNDQTQPLILYKTMFHPEVKNMFFVGMYKGSYFTVMEQQAKFACGVCAGNLAIPTNEEIQYGLKAEEAIRNMDPKPQYPHADYVKFADSIAELAGANLDLKSLKAANASLYEKFLSTTVIVGGFSIDNIEQQISASEALLAREAVEEKIPSSVSKELEGQN